MADTNSNDGNIDIQRVTVLIPKSDVEALKKTLQPTQTVSGVIRDMVREAVKRGR
tara:strand:- start:5337 stop:5501 length:165 start_codon:yes stop_codon:yes gene_type:complete